MVHNQLHICFQEAVYLLTLHTIIDLLSNQGTPVNGTTQAGSKTMDISSPYNTRHVTHVGFDAHTGEFTGLPGEWHVLLKHSGITKKEQEQNPQVHTNNVGIYLIDINTCCHRR